MSGKKGQVQKNGRVAARANGFTPKKRRRFIKTLRKTGCISDAARVAGISTTTADRWRKKDRRFANACERAIEIASEDIEMLAWERAVTGIEEPVYHYGKFSHMRVRRSDSIFRMLLIGSNKKKYGRMGAVDRKAIEDKLRAKVRAEELPRVATNEEVEESLLKALKAFGQRTVDEAGYVPAPWGGFMPPGYRVTWEGEGEEPGVETWDE